MEGVYYALGAAVGLAEGCVYAIDKLVPGGDTAIRALGIDALLPAHQHLAENGLRRHGEAPSEAAAAAGVSNHGPLPAPRELAKLNSFPVDDVEEELEATDEAAGAASPSDVPFPEAPSSPAGAWPSPARGHRRSAKGGDEIDERAAAMLAEASPTLRVPKLKLPGPREGLADSAHKMDTLMPRPTDIIMGPPASRLTEQNVVPFNAAFDAERAAARGVRSSFEEQDIITVATTNRYTYGLQAGGSASATPRSEAAASEGAFAGAGGGSAKKQKKRFSLFRGLRRVKEGQ